MPHVNMIMNDSFQMVKEPHDKQVDASNGQGRLNRNIHSSTTMK